MKGVVIILGFIFSFFAYADVSGQWECKTCGNTSIQLTLHDKNGHVSGNYCFISNNGNRIDCDGNSISGEAKNNSVELDFVNSWGDVGKAILIADKDGIVWKTNDNTPFLRANMAMPSSFTLRRMNNNDDLRARVLKECTIKNDVDVTNGFVSKGQFLTILGTNDDGSKFKIKIINKNNDVIGWLSDECVEIE